MQRKPRILIVEDERHIGYGLKFNCEQEGYEALLVEDGPSALKLLIDPSETERPFDLVILDLMLPGMSGYAVLEEIRKAKLDVAVLILSARTLPEDRIRGFDLGADQYLMKPFELPELLSRVRNLLRRSTRSEQGERNEPYRFGESVINFASHQATFRGEHVSLTALEIDLLKCFIEHEGTVLTRVQLLDRVWGMESSPTTRTVDNFVLRLRKAFEIDPANPRHFLSVRGVGYRFVKEPAETESEPGEPEES